MRTVRVNQAAVDQAIASAHNEIQRLWETSDTDLRALHRGRVEGTLDALLTLGLISDRDARDVRCAIGVAIEHSTD